MPYRTTNSEPPALRKRWWARPLCWTTGHTWVVTSFNRTKNHVLGHLHPDAGIDMFCARCGTEWNDADPSSKRCGVEWYDIDKAAAHNIATAEKVAQATRDGKLG